MVKKGDIITNPVTGERAVIILGTQETNGEKIIVDLFISPGGAVAGKHYHPNVTEKFIVKSGKVGFTVGTENIIAPLNEEITVLPMTIHDWWNAGDTEANVRIEISPGIRFENMIRNLFGLAHDKKVNKKGMPSFIQLIMISKEFEDVICFTKAPKWMVNSLYYLLFPFAYLTGIKGSYQKYINMQPK